MSLSPSSSMLLYNARCLHLMALRGAVEEARSLALLLVRALLTSATHLKALIWVSLDNRIQQSVGFLFQGNSLKNDALRQVKGVTWFMRHRLPIALASTRLPLIAMMGIVVARCTFVPNAE